MEKRQKERMKMEEVYSRAREYQLAVVDPSNFFVIFS